jgi:catechol 2,3-dioxygenase-like lactoylglutathione lyase family enzyme
VQASARCGLLARFAAAGKDTTMLGNRDAIATIAVKDLAKAREFYERTLGLEVVDHEGDEVLVFRSGKANINVYRSQYAGTNKATALSWSVGDELEGMVRALRGKGVGFEHYELPGTKREGDIHVAGDMKIAWFKDPDGNILSLNSD